MLLYNTCFGVCVWVSGGTGKCHSKVENGSTLEMCICLPWVATKGTSQWLLTFYLAASYSSLMVISWFFTFSMCASLWLFHFFFFLSVCWLFYSSHWVNFLCKILAEFFCPTLNIHAFSFSSYLCYGWLSSDGAEGLEEVLGIQLKESGDHRKLGGDVQIKTQKYYPTTKKLLACSFFRCWSWVWAWLSSLPRIPRWP